MATISAFSMPGRSLIEAAIARAVDNGMSRIELTVRADNHVAQALYRSLGFEFEGTQRKAWRLRGEYFDVHHMALLKGEE
ncbi:GNAT family N-acetyltransferase [Massilia endophytica]|uniref:GNAT family N-acetyltransferase n=1 Tax=Massilia endophytica TaxID=2899220 RepID=UPI001E5B3B05|nr:GNAT family N-acetyltransferase [Massilia endophytica]UGQ46943.1 GNAT family N-acetyltransferase [Massilia endophytica]